MKLEGTSPELQALGRWLFTYIKELGGRNGTEPVLQSSGWYRAPPTGKVCLYLYFIGTRGRSKHPNSVRLTTLWDEEVAKIPEVEKGNNWFGSPSADLHARPDDPHVKERVEAFVRYAFRAVAVEIVRSEPRVDPVVIQQVIQYITIFVDRRPEATSVAKTFKDLLGKFAPATASAVRDILVNVTSDVVKKLILGA